jgi:hypothetical protein
MLCLVHTLVLALPPEPSEHVQTADARVGRVTAVPAVGF